MCFNIALNIKVKRPTPQIAGEDIEVYKIIKRRGDGAFYNMYINGYLEKWTPGTWYYETTPFRGRYGTDYTSGFNLWRFEKNCFHSKITRDAAIRILNNRGKYSHKLVKMIIPKGAKYFKNSDEYISSDIIYPHAPAAKKKNTKKK